MKSKWICCSVSRRMSDLCYTHRHTAAYAGTKHPASTSQTSCMHDFNDKPAACMGGLAGLRGTYSTQDTGMDLTAGASNHPESGRGIYDAVACPHIGASVGRSLPVQLGVHKLWPHCIT